MNSISSIALSGMAAATLGLDASANNIANAQTPGYRRQSVARTEQPGGGVQAALEPAAQAGESLVEDAVQQRMDFYAFEANALVLRRADRMLGSLLDLKA